MNLKQYLDDCSKEQKTELAKKLDTSEAYLYQLANGFRNAGAKFLLNIESATNGKVTPIELRENTQAA